MFLVPYLAYLEDAAALRYVDEALRGDREFVLNALQRNAEACMYGRSRAWTCVEFLLFLTSELAGVAICRRLLARGGKLLFWVAVKELNLSYHNRDT